MQAYVGSEGYGFISYSFRDLETVSKLMDILQRDGYRFFMDCTYDTQTTMKPVADTNREPENIPRRIDGSKVFIVFLSQGAVRSMNVKNEISYAVSMGKNIVVAYLEECELPDSLGIALSGRKSIDLFKCSSKEEMAEEIKKECPDSVFPKGDTFADELKELFLTETVSNQPAAAKTPEEKKEEYNYYLIVRRLDGSGAMYQAAITDRAMIGRAQPGNAINFDDMYVARLHCEIRLVDEQLFIRDNNSTNHTYCDNRLVSSDTFERVSVTGRYKIGKFYYSIGLEKRLKPVEDESRTVFYKQMLDEFQEVAKGANQISTKSLLMDHDSLVNQKFNEALKKWKKLTAGRYIIDLLCEQLDIKFERADRYRIYDEVNLYNSLSNLSTETYNDILTIANAFVKFEVEKLEDENAQRYISCLGRYMEPLFIAEKIVECDSNFILYVVTPIFDLDEDQLSYLLKHVLKRKGIDYYNSDEFLLWVSIRVDTDSRFALLMELRTFYAELKNTGHRTGSDDEDVSVTVYIGYNAEENYLDKLDETINVEDVRRKELVTRMLRWHINLEKKSSSAATVRFYELYNEINKLYASEIADIKVMKKNMSGSEPDPEEASENRRGSYNVSLKYDGSGKIGFKYTAKEHIVLQPGMVLFESTGRFNRVNGKNDFALINPVEIQPGSGELTLDIKCVSEQPFQMAKLRKKGTASIAEKDTISMNAEFAARFFESVEITNKPICIFFEKFSSTGEIREYLYSNVDRKDLFDEWFFGDNRLSLDMSLFEAEWFTDSKLTDEMIEKFDSANGYEQRCGILLMLYMKFCKENFGTDIPYQKLIKKFSKMVDYEMDEIRFEGINYGNAFDCLLCYLMMTSSPVDNLRLLYKEAFN